MTITLNGLRTVVYPTNDLATSKAIWSELLGFAPYFDQPFYVGFEVGGYELALDPDGNVDDGPLVYWGVDDIEACHDRLIAGGAAPVQDVAEVGDDIYVAVVCLPDGNRFGIIENPHFKAT